ncbi:MAG: extracellular solute-binding protein [bacterium]
MDRACSQPGRLYLGIVTLLVLGPFLITGCGRVDRSTTIAIWEQMDPVERALLDTNLIRFVEQNPQYAHFQFDRVHYRPDDIHIQFQTAAMAYSGPNLVYGPSDKVGPYTIMGLIEPLDEFLPETVLGRFDPASLPTLEGHVWGLPDQIGNHLTLVANRAYVDSIPSDTETWLAQLHELTVDEDGNGHPEIYGLVFNFIEPFWLAPWLGGYGGWVMDEAGNPTLDSEAMASAIEFLQRLKESGVIPRECTYPVADTLFKEGKAAYIINGPWSWSDYREAGIEIVITPLPMVTETGLWPSPMTSPKCYSVNRYHDPATTECTRALLDFLTSTEAQVELALAAGVQPTDLAARAHPAVLADATLIASQRQIEKGRQMPIVAEMRAIWDAMRPPYQSALNGRLTSVEAARQMQERAERTIREMKE